MRACARSLGLARRKLRNLKKSSISRMLALFTADDARNLAADVRDLAAGLRGFAADLRDYLARS